MSTKQLTSIALYPSAEAIEEACRALAELKSGASTTLPGVDSLGPYFDLESCELAVERKGLMLRVSLEDIPFELLPFLQRRTRLSWVDFYYSGADPSDPFYAVDGEERPREVFERAALALEPTYALLVAWELDDKKGIEAAIAKGADVNVRLGERVLLVEALLRPELVSWRSVLEAGADPNAVDEYGYFPLYTAKNAETCRVLLAAGADVNLASRLGTALSAAISAPEVMEVLLQVGADVRTGDPPVHFEALSHSSDDPAAFERTMQLLAAAGARFDEPCAKGGNARWYAGGSPRAHRFLDALGIPKAMTRPVDAYARGDRMGTAIFHADGEKIAELIAGCESESESVVAGWFYTLLSARSADHDPPFAWFEPHLRALIAARPEIAKAMAPVRSGHQRWPEAAALMPEVPPQAAPTPRRRGIIRRILLKLLGG